MNYPRVITEVEILPLIISNKNKHLHFRGPTYFSTYYFELITSVNDFIIENSETSRNRPYTTTNIISKVSFEEYDQDISQLNSDNNAQIIRNQEPQQLNIVHDQQPDTTTLRNLPDSSDTLTVQIISELSDTTTNNSKIFYRNSLFKCITNPCTKCHSKHNK